VLNRWVFSVLVLLGAISAFADVLDDCDQAKDPDLSIKGCTIIIDAGRKSAPFAFNNRGVAYKAKGDYERAIADFSKAIEIDPNYVTAYTNRALTYKDKGEYQLAIADFSKAIELDPKNACTFTERSPLRQRQTLIERRHPRPAVRHRAQNRCLRRVPSLFGIYLSW
jgi:tetratricopeptide (TPR) repeat protein